MGSLFTIRCFGCVTYYHCGTSPNLRRWSPLSSLAADRLLLGDEQVGVSASDFVLGSPLCSLLELVKVEVHVTADASILAVDLLTSTGACWAKLSRFLSKLVLQTFKWTSRGQGPTGDTVSRNRMERLKVVS